MTNMERQESSPIEAQGAEQGPRRPSGGLRARAKKGAADVVQPGNGAITTAPTPSDDTSWLMTDAEALEDFDASARRYLGISGAEFLRRWDAGEYPDPDDTPGVMAVAFLIPLIRD